jgi:hypothetical protein
MTSPTKTLEDLIKKFKGLDDKSLLNVIDNIAEYTVEAKEAISTIIEEEGGLENVKLRMKAEQEKEAEANRIRRLTQSLFEQNMQQTEILAKVTSSLLSEPEISELVAKTIADLEHEQADLKVKPRTILGGILGAAIGGTIGGVFWGASMIYSGRMIFFFVFGAGLLSYGLIRLFTNQSRKNVVVLLLAVASTLYALALGQILYEVIGYQGS